jgi:hypothetical protein
VTAMVARQRRAAKESSSSCPREPPHSASFNLAYACAGAGLHASRLPVFRDAVVTMRANLPIAILPGIVAELGRVPQLVLRNIGAKSAKRLGHRTLEGNRERCVSYFPLRWFVQKMHGRARRPKNNGATRRVIVTIVTFSEAETSPRGGYGSTPRAPHGLRNDANPCLYSFHAWWCRY